MENTNERELTDFLTDTTTNVGGTERAVSAIAGGALLGYGLKEGGLLGTIGAIVGGMMLYRGASGHCHLYDAMDIDTSESGSMADRSPFGRRLLSGRIHVTKSALIDRSPSDIYEFWRNFENLPKVMDHLESVTVGDGNRSHWKAKGPAGTSVEWDAELTSDVPNERIGWKSVEGSDIPNSGVVEFRPTSDRGTIVRVTMIYEAPGGKLGELVAGLFGEEPHIQVAEDLRRLKRLMETGTVISTEGQSSAREPVKPKSRSAGA